MKKIKNILQNIKEADLTIDLVFFVYGVLLIISIACIYLSTEYERVCFHKSQLTELEKSLKTNKLLRGAYNDL